MKLHLALIPLAIIAAAHATPLAEIDLPSTGYDIGAFRKYSEMKKVPVLGGNSLRVFFMRQGEVTKAVEVSLESGQVTLWPDWSDESEAKVFTLARRELAAINSALTDKDLDEIQDAMYPSSDGTCSLLEIRDKRGYYWRLHRNSTSGYFRALVALVDLVSLQAGAK